MTFRFASHAVRDSSSLTTAESKLANENIAEDNLAKETLVKEHKEHLAKEII